jgi:hypothetical protein
MSQFFVRIREGQTAQRPALIVPVNPGSVTGISGPEWEELDPRVQRVLEETADVLPGKHGKELYDNLDPVRKACVLNIAAKSAATRLLDGSTCLDHFGGLVTLRADRFFARTKGALREEAKNAKLVFRPAPDTLHHPPVGYTNAGSVKTLDRYGNLQLSFFRRGTTGDDYLVDVDIDEASGIEHGFEVVRNTIADHTTSPYDVRDILIRHQLLDPGYGFVFAAQAQVVRVASA